MKKLKVMTIVGTRQVITRMSAVINKLEVSNAIGHTLVHTGQNYELKEVFKNFYLTKPNCFHNAAIVTAVEKIGDIPVKLNPIIEDVESAEFLGLEDINRLVWSKN